ncbi:MAG: hypothetical protein IJ515_01950 [Clostridia bacterium]|nr:hypothetical protein [Clostridia bacterium]
MYCNKCGKYIDSDNRLCAECEEIERLSKLFADEGAQEQINLGDFGSDFASSESAQPQRTEIPNFNYFYNTANTTEPSSPNKKNPRMAGFPLGLTSVILATVNYFLLIICIALIAAESAVGLVFTVLSAPSFILSIVFGAKVIGLANKAKKSGAPTPIAPLVLGIIGLSISALMLFILLIAILSI